MSSNKIQYSDSFIETYADFASFAPVTSSDDKLVYIHFISNKSIPAVVSLEESKEEVGKANLQIGSVTELRHECTVLMGMDQLKTFRDNIDVLLEQLKPQQGLSK
ncbi:TPA: hypothetical protein ONC27_001695 [Enterobacter asburiae]|jgi:hypothetical protein|uniref:hypothetical protein n=1 Tax=Enterobacter TaxID=547 RepID=UPI001A14FEFD|nr:MULTISPECIES: hypothetical protein [Enterobacter]ELW9292787.1 hypothetical protein [Enterobacter roggenkampii]EGQ5321661.1 hypothetical protein [Enterobacter asburiae]MCW7770975.1 hypothetical protein [Enterobacter asburiae]MEB2382972.1 hypothetical protein [Enterobacter sp. R-1.5.3]MEB2431153.1 hypothetical protein [Enterobacter sp. R-1.6.2]